MPTITRSSDSESKKRSCYETETPSIPKINGRFENIKNKKRKLAEELSAHCQVNEKLNSSYQGTVSRNKNKASTKTTQIECTERDVVDGKKKTRQTKSKLSNGSKVPARKPRKGKGSKVISSSKICSESSVISISENIETGKIDKCDYNQRRVSKAIEDISNKNGKNETLNSPENNDHCCVSLEMLKTSENITDDVTDEGKELSDKEEENYQHKYFQLLDMMKELQEEFLISQQNIEQHVIANDAFLEEMKVTLEEERKELVLTKEELETCKVRNFELEKCKNNHEQEVIILNKKVEEVTTKLLQNNEAKESENYIQSKIDDQNDILNFYKLLTGLCLKKEVNDSVKLDDVTFRCTMKTSKTEEIKFTLTQDHEFYEVEYKPLLCDSEQAKKAYSSLPKYLRDQIFFEDKLAPKFLLRLLRAVHAPS